MRTFFVGDIHGCIEELDQLLYLLNARSGDRFVFLGDYVDRGPDSLGVLRRVRETLHKYPNSIAIAGNHEETPLLLRDRGRALPSWAKKATDDDWDFLDKLPLFYRLPEIRTIVVHGGMYPRYFDLYGSLGEPSLSWRTDSGKKAERQRRFLRVRMVDGRGKKVDLGKERPGDRHWASVYNGREGFCFFGHDPQLNPPTPLLCRYAMGLDTGCCFGGMLTAAVVEENSNPRDATIVSVQSKARYAQPKWLRNLDGSVQFNRHPDLLATLDATRRESEADGNHNLDVRTGSLDNKEMLRDTLRDTLRDDIRDDLIDELAETEDLEDEMSAFAAPNSSAK